LEQIDSPHGGQALRLLTDFGYTGRIYPVNPKYDDIKGLTCYPDLLAVPQPCAAG
jgi:acyl-CoA synthetase (NDP forming)